jgi:diguanylate cyclase (GGDEF)-like protein
LHLELRTISVLIAISSLIYGLSINLVAAGLPRGLKGGRIWAYGNLAMFLAWFLIGVRGFIPDFLSIVIGNSLLILSFAFFSESLLVFREKPHNRLQPYIIAGFVAVIQYAFSEIWPNIAARVIVISVVGAAIFFQISWSFRMARSEVGSPHSRPTASMVEAVGFLTGVVYLIRAIHAVYTMAPNDSLFEPNYFHELSFVVFFISSVLLSFGFVLINLIRLYVKQERLATYDSLTGVYNRHAVFDLLEQRLMDRNGGPDRLSLLMIDLDRFKIVNDRLGHPDGDKILAQIGRAIQNATRPGDILGRVGGDEFLVIMPGTNEREAVAIADRLRSVVSDALRDFIDPDMQVTLSIGVAERDESKPYRDELVRRTDKALYRAKRAGGNQVVAYRDGRPSSASER